VVEPADDPACDVPDDTIPTAEPDEVTQSVETDPSTGTTDPAVPTVTGAEPSDVVIVDDASPGETDADDESTATVTPTPVPNDMSGEAPTPTAAPVDVVTPTASEPVVTATSEADDTVPTKTAVPIVPDDTSGTGTEATSVPDGVAIEATATVDPTAAVVVPDESPAVDLDPTAVIVVDDDPGTSTTMASTGVDGQDEPAPVLDLPAGAAPGGALALSLDQGRFLVGDGRGGPLWVVGRDGPTTRVAVDAAFYPMWEPGGGRFSITYYPAGSDQPSVAVVDAATGALTPVTIGPPTGADPAAVEDDAVSGGDEEVSAEDEGGGVVRDVSAGWLGGQPIVQRTYPDDPGRGVELWRAGDTAPFWSAPGQAALTRHPFQAGDRVILAASGGWVAVSASGAEADLGPVTTGGATITDAVVGPSGTIAYATSGQVLIAPATSPGAVVLVMSVSGGEAAWFDWSPAGDALVIADGAGLTFVAADGTVLGTVAVPGSPQGPGWVGDGVLYVDAATQRLWLLPTASLPT